MRRAIVVAFVFPLFAGACGGGGGGGGPGSQVLGSVGSVDGSVDSTGALFTDGLLLVGDTAANHGIKSFVRFDLSSVPSGAVVLTATLTTWQWGTAGDSYGSIGDVTIDHVDLGPGLSGDDYYSVAFATDVATLSDDPTPGPRTADVTAEVLADLLAARTTSDYRLHLIFDSTLDGEADLAYFSSGDDTGGSGVYATLTLVYL